jgi:PAS domain S-box-containing protein
MNDSSGREASRRQRNTLRNAHSYIEQPSLEVGATECGPVGRQQGALAEAVEHAEDGIVITDAAGTITYVNPAFAHLSGYARSELLGQNPRILQSGVHSAAFYRRLWTRLTAGKSFSGVFINRRKDGSLAREEAIISPFRNDDGQVSGYVGIKRTMDDGRIAVRELARERADRAAVVTALESLEPGGDLIETSGRVCERIVGVSDFRLAAIIAFDEDGAVPLVVRTADAKTLTLPRRLPAAEATGLREVSLKGPWIRALDRGDARALTAPARERGITILGAAPLRTNAGLPGVLLVGAAGDDPTVAERLLPALAEFGALASALLCVGLHRRADRRSERLSLRRIVRNAAFEPVFQPVVHVAGGGVVGYELLTRFSDGIPPQERFGAARAVGLGRQLEIATLRYGLNAAAQLPPGAWLSVNVGPDLLGDARTLKRLLVDVNREVIIELTEHEVIADYAAVRVVVEQLGPGVSLAVDDAGAGYASLRHILELRPRYVKIDAGIVRGMDGDPARQALVAGIRFFADRAGCHLIAEGVETDAERDTLADLGIAMAQGYLFGSPRSIDDTVGAGS